LYRLRLRKQPASRNAESWKRHRARLWYGDRHQSRLCRLLREPDGELGPEWFEKFDVKPNGDAEFFFPD